MKRLLEEDDVTDLERALLRSVSADEAPADGADKLYAELVNRSEASAPVAPLRPLASRSKIPSWVWLAAAVLFGVGLLVLDRSRQSEKIFIVHDMPSIAVPTTAPAPVASAEPAVETQLPPPAAPEPSATPSASPSSTVKVALPKGPASSAAKGGTVAQTLGWAIGKASVDVPHETMSFDKGAAAKALGSVDLRDCEKVPGPTGAGHVTVTFSPDGSVASAVVDQGPYPGTARGGCVAGKYRAAHVPPFSGPNVRVGKSFAIN